MESTTGGHCGKCGAPYSYPLNWNSIMPAPAQPSCNCWNVPRVVTVTSSDSQEAIIHE